MSAVEKERVKRRTEAIVMEMGMTMITITKRRRKMIIVMIIMMKIMMMMKRNKKVTVSRRSTSMKKNMRMRIKISTKIYS